MNSKQTIAHGTAAWFEMAGRAMCDAAAQAGLSGNTDVSLVEHYSDGVDLGEGRVQGLRFDIIKGKPSFRVGVHPGETADIMVEVSTAASCALNSLYSGDPAYPAALARFQAAGALRVGGEMARLGPWFAAVHDVIVAHTAAPAGHFSLSHKGDMQ